MKKLISFFVAIVFVLTASPAVAVDDWLPTEPENPPGFNYETDSMGRNGITHFLISEAGGHKQSLAYYRTSTGDWLDCSKATSSLDCGTGKKGEIQGNAMLPVCSEVIESCIEKVWVYKRGETQQEAVFKKTVEGWKFQGLPAKGIPNGSAMSIWQSPILHTGGNGDYAVAAQLNFNASSSNGIQIDSLDLKIAPVNEYPEPNGEIGVPYICVAPDGKQKQPCGSTIGFMGASNCLYIQVGVCAKSQVPAESSRFGLQLILHNDVTGWFRGRVADPNITVSKVNSMYNRVTIHADPVELPKILVTLDTSKGDPDLRALYPRKIFGNQNYGGAESSWPSTVKMVETIRAKAKDTASGVSSLWAISTINARSAANGSSRCLEDSSRLVGIVTTNAMAYTGTSPKWSNGFLSYDVAGLHYLPDGTTAKGTYDLVIRSDAARCLYGFSNAPLSATVSVTNEKGTKTTATTVVSEKNGWLKMAAYGFTFSNKTIKVKITKKLVKKAVKKK